MVNPQREPHKYSIRTTAGRPPAYDSPQEMAAHIDAYFAEWCPGEFELTDILDKKGRPTGQKQKRWLRPAEPPTITGLALYLGFDSRQSMQDYSTRNYGKEEFAYVIKRAKARVEHGYELNLQNAACGGSIFALKNMGWGDSATVKHEGIPETKEPKINIYTGHYNLAENEAEVDGEKTGG